MNALPRSLHEASHTLLRGQRRRTHDELLADAQAGCQRLAIASRSWLSFPPGKPAIDEALNTAEGLRLTLCELRGHEEVGSTSRK